MPPPHRKEPQHPAYHHHPSRLAAQDCCSAVHRSPFRQGLKGSIMTNLKLAKLPDRTPTRITITVSADLNQALCDYQKLYAAAYGASEKIADLRSEEHTSELQSLMRISYAVFCLKQKKNRITT